MTVHIKAPQSPTAAPPGGEKVNITVLTSTFTVMANGAGETGADGRPTT